MQAFQEEDCRILLADDHAVVRQGLRLLLEREGCNVVAEAADGREAVAAASQAKPTIAVLDLSMPMMNGLDAATQMLQAVPEIKVILLTMHAEERFVLESLKIGVKGYVLKSKASDHLIEAIREVARGNLYLSPEISRTVVQAYLTKQEYTDDGLSPREREVLQLIAEGCSTKEIAGLLGISAKTAEAHRGRIMDKLNLRDTARLVRYAIRKGLIEP